MDSITPETEANHQLEKIFARCIIELISIRKGSYKPIKLWLTLDFEKMS